jgi:hypothetical protein
MLFFLRNKVLLELVVAVCILSFLPSSIGAETLSVGRSDSGEGAQAQEGAVHVVESPVAHPPAIKGRLV